MKQPNLEHSLQNLRPLDRSFFLPTADQVARLLVGHYLMRRGPQGWSGGPVVETEAYLEKDPASHAFKGPTLRNRSMFAEPGTAYVYLIYGLHFCVNATCRPAGTGEAVLIRAIEPMAGLQSMQALRPNHPMERMAAGPAKLCQALGIDRALDGVDLCDLKSPLILAFNPDRDSWVAARGGVMKDRRIGIQKAAELPLRFLLRDSPSLSIKPSGKI